tara:strand:+ start:2591 stop:2869 length:279 start_codon:yes stop_codon:yes gene_type:complete
MSAVYENDKIRGECSFNGFPFFNNEFVMLLSERQRFLFVELESSCYSLIDNKEKREISITLCNIDYLMETFTFPYRDQADYDKIISYVYYFY